MSDPSSSLRKAKKLPLPGGSQGTGRAVPFRNKPPDFLGDSDKLLDDVLSQTAAKTASSKRAPSQASGKAPSDIDLMSSMMGRISQLELQVKFYAKEIIDKDKKINILEEKVKLMQKYGDEPAGESRRVKELERKCQSLQEQMQDMEDFLADYGMVWLGATHDDAAPSSRVHGLYQEIEETQTDFADKQTVWRPGTSLVSREDTVPDFDLLIKNVKELNILAGEGEKKITHTVSGAKFKTVDSIPLTLYANGIFMFNGPFRAYEEPETQQCMQDLMDGYFPAELQNRHPEGIPININDQRDTVFKDPRNQEFFKGTGLTLGGDTDGTSRLVPSHTSTATSMESSGPPVSGDHAPLNQRETSKPPVEPMSVEQFLNKLHPTITKDGKVVDVKSSVADLLKHDSTPNTVTVVDTPIVQDIKERARSGSSNRPLSSRKSPRVEVTTLRVRSESGDHTFILKLRFTDTISDLRMHLDKQRKTKSGSYELVTTFPNRVYSDLSATLEECGLTPNATILVRLKNK